MSRRIEDKLELKFREVRKFWVTSIAISAALSLATICLIIA